MRKTFTMTAAQRDKLLEAMQPVPAMWIGGPPRSVQENANDAWMALGREMGFDAMTVQSVPGASVGELAFSAEEAPITRPPQKSPADLEYESWSAAGVTGAPARRQYYYRTNECTATDATDPACVCWHDAGTGPRANADPSLLNWRDAPGVKTPLERKDG